MSRRRASLAYRMISVVLVVAAFGVWGLHFWSYYWLKAPAIVESVSSTEVHINGRTVWRVKTFSRIAEHDFVKTEIRYRFRSAGTFKTGSRIRIGADYVEDSAPSPKLRQGDDISVLLPYEGADYSVLYPGLRELDLAFTTLAVMLWHFLPSLINRFVAMVVHTLRLRR